MSGPMFGDELRVNRIGPCKRANKGRLRTA